MSDQAIYAFVLGVVIVLLVLIYRYRHEISISGKRGSVEFKVEAKNAPGEIRPTETTGNRQSVPPLNVKAAARGVAIGGEAEGATIITGDKNKAGS